MRKVERGLCLTCDRHFPPAVSSCVIAEDGVGDCPHYLEKKGVDVSVVLVEAEVVEEPMEEALPEEEIEIVEEEEPYGF